MARYLAALWLLMPLLSWAGIIGNWQGSQTDGRTVMLQLQDDNTGYLNGQAMSYEAGAGILTLQFREGGGQIYQYNQQSELLYLQGGDLPAMVQLHRLVEQNHKPRILAGTTTTPNQLVGEWCLLRNNGFSNVISDECLILTEDGIYRYRGAGAKKTGVVANAWAGTDQYTTDNGRWTATKDSLTAFSAAGAQRTYQLERRYYVDNQRPMICLDQRCYVASSN